jgi:hypothetical protein
MALLEYQNMPSLRDVAHDGVLCTFSNRAAPGWGNWCGPSGQAAWTVHHVQNYNLRGLFPLASQRAAVLGSPLVFVLIGCYSPYLGDLASLFSN